MHDASTLPFPVSAILAPWRIATGPEATAVSLDQLRGSKVVVYFYENSG